MQPLPSNTALITAFLFALLGGACGIFDATDPGGPGDEVTAVARLEAEIAQGECIHMFLPGEDFPSGKVCATQNSNPFPYREQSIRVIKGNSYEFRAGRNGVILDTQPCRVTDGDASRLHVVWIGAGLQCREGFK